MKKQYQDYSDTVRGNIRRFRERRGLSHRAVAEGLAERLGCKATGSQSQSNEKARALPYARIAALAELFGVQPWEFFVENPPHLGWADIPVGTVPEFHSLPEPVLEEEPPTDDTEEELFDEAARDQALQDMAVEEGSSRATA